MYFRMRAKLNVGRRLNSDAIIADANCTQTCFYLSIILLASSGLYEIFHIGYIDIAGSLGIAYFAFTEGREAFEKAGIPYTTPRDCKANHCLDVLRTAVCLIKEDPTNLIRKLKNTVKSHSEFQQFYRTPPPLSPLSCP